MKKLQEINTGVGLHFPLLSLDTSPGDSVSHIQAGFPHLSNNLSSNLSETRSEVFPW